MTIYNCYQHQVINNTLPKANMDLLKIMVWKTNFLSSMLIQHWNPPKKNSFSTWICLRCLEKVKNILPNGGFMVIYHRTK